MRPRARGRDAAQLPADLRDGRSLPRRPPLSRVCRSSISDGRPEARLLPGLLDQDRADRDRLGRAPPRVAHACPRRTSSSRIASARSSIRCGCLTTGSSSSPTWYRPVSSRSTRVERAAHRRLRGPARGGQGRALLMEAWDRYRADRRWKPRARDRGRRARSPTRSRVGGGQEFGRSARHVSRDDCAALIASARPRSSRRRGKRRSASSRWRQWPAAWHPSHRRTVRSPSCSKTVATVCCSSPATRRRSATVLRDIDTNPQRYDAYGKPRANGTRSTSIPKPTSTSCSTRTASRSRTRSDRRTDAARRRARDPRLLGRAPVRSGSGRRTRHVPARRPRAFLRRVRPLQVLDRGPHPRVSRRSRPRGQAGARSRNRRRRRVGAAHPPRRGWSGIDLTPESVERVGTRLALRDLPFDDLPPGERRSTCRSPTRSFDMVFSHGVLHHVPEIHTAQREIHGCCDPTASSS